MTTRYTVEYNNNILRYIKIFNRDNLAVILFSSYDVANILETSEDNILIFTNNSYSIMSFGSEDNVKFVHPSIFARMALHPTVGEPINKTLFDNFYRFREENMFPITNEYNKKINRSFSFGANPIPNPFPFRSDLAPALISFGINTSINTTN